MTNHQLRWSHDPLLPSLNTGQVMLWRIPLVGWSDQDLAWMQKQLGRVESTRMSKLSSASAIQRFTICRSVMRGILSHYLQCDAGALTLAYNRYGKPGLSADILRQHPLYFNLSHSGNFALFALTKDAEVGVDIEYDGKSRDVLRLAQRFFHPQEYRALQQLVPEQRQLAFIRAWTRKEALAKAVGSGIQFAFNRFEVSIDSDARILSLDPSSYNGNAKLLSLPLEPPYSGCLAVLTQQSEALLIDWPCRDIFRK